jgi:hypothetical protein
MVGMERVLMDTTVICCVCGRRVDVNNTEGATAARVNGWRLLKPELTFTLDNVIAARVAGILAGNSTDLARCPACSAGSGYICYATLPTLL